VEPLIGVKLLGDLDPFIFTGDISSTHNSTNNISSWPVVDMVDCSLFPEGTCIIVIILCFSWFTLLYI